VPGWTRGDWHGGLLLHEVSWCAVVRQVGTGSIWRCRIPSDDENCGGGDGGAPWTRHAGAWCGTERRALCHAVIA